MKPAQTGIAQADCTWTPCKVIGRCRAWNKHMINMCWRGSILWTVAGGPEGGVTGGLLGGVTGGVIGGVTGGVTGGPAHAHMAQARRSEMRMPGQVCGGEVQLWLHAKWLYASTGVPVLQLFSLDAQTAVHGSASICVTYRRALPPLATRPLGALVVHRQP